MYEPTLKSLRSHKVPAWFEDAKLGIMITWGLYSIPAYAPIGRGTSTEIMAREGYKSYFTNMPYSEWYINSLRIPGSPVQKYHHEKYGDSVSYFDFVARFKQASLAWDPETWGDLFGEAGARYIVFITKHMDGFLMWPSKTPNYRIPGYHSDRDIVSELANAIKKRDIRLGLYYSSLLDQSFTGIPMADIAGLYSEGGLIDRRYAEYQFGHWMELIERYKPSLLWGDIGYPPYTSPLSLFSHFYNKIAEGLVNDRWAQFSPLVHGIVRSTYGRALLNRYAMSEVAKGKVGNPLPPHYDFTTPEYATLKEISLKKWETCRGLGNSFAYNRMETEADHISLPALIRLLVDVVSKNGNLLIDVGPMADGTIPETQVKLLRGLGAWLKIFGEAIYGSRPWVRAEGETTGGVTVRFTQKGETLYVFLMDAPKSEEVVIKDFEVKVGTVITDLSSGASLGFRRDGGDISMELPKAPTAFPVRVLAVHNLSK